MTRSRMGTYAWDHCSGYMRQHSASASGASVAKFRLWSKIFRSPSAAPSNSTKAAAPRHRIDWRRSKAKGGRPCGETTSALSRRPATPGAASPTALIPASGPG